MHRVIDLAIAPVTKQAYDSVMDHFEEFSLEMEYLGLWPVPVDHLLHYCVVLHGKELSMSFIKGHLSALAITCKTQGLQEATHNFRL